MVGPFLLLIELYGILYGIQLPIHPLYLPIYHAQGPTSRCLHPIVQNHWHSNKTHRVLTNVILCIQFFATFGVNPYLP